MRSKDSTGSLSLKEIIKERIFRIPLYQRAYKWEEKNAKKLFEDLMESFINETKKSVGLITLYTEDNKVYDVIDGQQRLITFSIIFNLLKSKELIEKIIFERDNNGERKGIIKNIDTFIDEVSTAGFTDGDRIIRNAKAILDMKKKHFDIINDDEKRNGFINHIKEKCFMLCSVVNQAATEEFMNLNAYKTPFSVCDYMRSNLISLNTFYKDELEGKEYLLAPVLGRHSYKTSISKLYEEIINILYDKEVEKKGDYKTVYDVVKQKCYNDPSKTNESRINIIFTELIKEYSKDKNSGYRCDNINLNFDDWVKQLIWIAYAKNLLVQLQYEMKGSNFSSAKLIDDYCKNSDKSFFSLISEDVKIDKQTSNDLARILYKKNSINNVIVEDFKVDDIKEPNLYFEALCTAEHNKSTSKSYYNNLSRKEYLDIKLNENVLSDCIQGSGRYIIDIFLKEQQRYRDAFFKVAPTIDFVDRENPKFKSVQDEDEWSIGKLFAKDIAIPVIQRDYCMGNTISKDKENEDFLGFIINAFNKRNPVIASTIIIAIEQRIEPNTEKIYIFDGQQRTYTLYQILRYLNYEKLKEYKFIGRNDISCEIRDPKSFIEASIINLRTAIDERCKDIWKNGEQENFANFIINNVKFKVKIISEISDAEQFFIDINGGVPLENYEIFKSCLVNILPSDLKENWTKKLENTWLKFFYNSVKKIYGNHFSNNHSEEELMQMRFIEFLCRWLYSKNNPSNKLPTSFDIIKSKSELTHSLNYLTEIKFEEVEKIMDEVIRICNIEKDNVWYSEEKIVEVNEKAFLVNSKKEVVHIMYASLDKNIKINENHPYFLKRFIRSCSKQGREFYFDDKNEKAIGYYDEDKILDNILSSILENNKLSELGVYKLKKLDNKICILGGYQNWSDEKLVSKFEYMTENELPIYYIDIIFNKKGRWLYYNLHKYYKKALAKEEKNKVKQYENAIYLFLLTPKELYFDTGGIFEGDFKRKKEYSNGVDFSLRCNCTEYDLFINTRSAYGIRLNKGENTILNKIE